MVLTEFIENFADQFEDTDKDVFTPELKFRELEEWSSLTGMSLIAMVKTAYGKTLTGSDMRACETILDLYNLINNK